jgi:hypothetical protein
LLTATPVRTHCRHSSRNPYRLALIALGLALGCTRSNPAYLGPHPGNDGGMRDSGAGGGSPDVAVDMTVVDTGVDRGPDRTPDTGTGDTKIDANKPDVKTDAADGGDGGVVNCIDLDGDGYGVGTGCLGPDCDDTNNAFHDTATRPCPTGTTAKGTCRPGSQTCTGGVWSICIGEVSATGEACNGEDDDCDGMADNNLPAFTCGQGACQNTIGSCSSTGGLEDCLPHPSTDTTGDDTCDSSDNDCDGLVDQNCPTVIAACIHVSPTGSDATGTTGGITNPFQTIQAALAFIGPTTPKSICVAGGPTCQDQAIYTVGDTNNPFKMLPGVSIYGNYESTGWKRCALSPTAPLPTVTLALHENSGVQFPNTINTPTALDGFVLTRNNGGNGNLTISAVTVNGAKQVRLANLVVNDTPNAGNTYGVDLMNGGEALITHCQIFGGGGTMTSIGVHSLMAKPTIRENCSVVDASTGRCTAGCSGSPGLVIAGAASATNGFSTGILLDTSPGASVETSTICGTQGLNASGVHIKGDATGTMVRGSQISASAGTADSVGVRIDDCNNAAPWIVGNAVIQGQGSKRSAGIVATGACRPVIDGNAQINGGGAGTDEADGVSCETNTSGVASLCAVLGNRNIQGSSAAGPTTSAGIACKGHGCARVASNVVTGNAGNNVIGVWLVNDGTMVEQNAISGGCGTVTSVGILANDSFARVQNNLVSAGACALLATPQPAYLGMRVVLASGVNEMDIDSNTIDGGGATAGVCRSTAVEYGAGNDVAMPVKGVIRNNILRGGVCLTTRIDFSESRANTDPRVFQNNDLDPTGAPTLYLDENTTAKTAATINTFPDTSASGNISVDPMFVSFPTNQRIGTGSALKGAGTSTAAPANDFEGNLRSATKPSIGAYE